MSQAELSDARVPVVEQLAEWICALDYASIPERVLERARHQVLNVLAAVHAGSETHAGRAVLAAARGFGGAGPCTVIPTGEKLPLHDAVLVNSAFSMALDYDDYLYMGHTGHSAVLASWAIAEAEKSSTRDFITAQVIANEIGGRVGASAVLGPQNGQAWSFLHAVEGAAVAAKLYDLSVEQTAHALAIAMYQPTFTLWPGFMGPESKVLTAAGPTVTGMQAAAFARQGLTGASRIFEHPRKGFWASFTYAPMPEMLSGLGQAWVTDTLTFKKHPGCAYIDTTLDALFDALREFDHDHGRAIAPSEVARIVVRASLLTVEMDNLSAEHVDASAALSPVNINFSIPFNVAIGVIAGRHSAAELSQAFLDRHEHEIRELAGRTELEHDWSMSFDVARAFAGALGRNSPARRLGPRDVVRVLAGYASQMGGTKAHSLDLPALARRSAAALARLVADFAKQGRQVGARAELGLAQADFTRFRMALPASVRIETLLGEHYKARQNVPFGAPGQERYFETVIEKFLLETEARLGTERAGRALELVKHFERHALGDLTAAVCEPKP
jgi:2-methylcitrate dehydratase PrpD